jgi:chemotaxis protein methyltransferase CheR
VLVSKRELEHEVQELLEAIFQRYQYDFRLYSQASLVRRIHQAAERLADGSIQKLGQAALDDGRAFSQLLDYLTVSYTDMFRDPLYFLKLREQVVPILRTYPSLKVWVAGSSTGEEVYSLAILLHEEGLLDRTIIYATDINAASLQRAEAGIYEVGRFRKFTENHRLSGGKGSLSDYYQASHGLGVMDRALRKQVVFSDHSLATDSVFAEVQLVSCRNVLIYFKKPLQDRAMGLFRESLCRRGFLGLGIKESVRFGAHADAFDDLCPEVRLYRRKG